MLQQVEAGEEVVITIDGRPVAVLRPLGDRPSWMSREDVAALPDELAVSVVTVGELRAGVLAARDVRVRDRRLRTLAEVLTLEPLPVDRAVADAWARLRLDLRAAGRPMPVNDSWIAATAIALAVPLVTQDDDHAEVEGLTVVRV